MNRIWCSGIVLVALATGDLDAAANGASAVQAMQLARDAATAMEAKDYSAAVEKLAGAVELRPDFSELLLNLAIAQAGAGQSDEAVATLQRYAAFGVTSAVDKTPEFAALKPRRDFQDLVKKILANGHPKGTGDIAFSLRDATGLIEGIACRGQTGEFYFGDVHHRAVWVRQKDNTLRRLTAEGDELLGVHGLTIDESNGTLWAATAAVPAMRGFSADQAGQAALVEVDVQTGALRRVLSPPRTGPDAAHRFTDIALGGDGTVYVVDAESAAVWRTDRNGQALAKAAESPEFFSLQAIAVLASGTVVVADQVNGLLRIDARTGQVAPLGAPEGVTLTDINSLTVAPDGRLLALQTGLRPSRVLSIEIDAGAESIGEVQVLDSGHVAMGAPSQGCIGADGDFYFVANAGWSRFLSSDQPTPPRQVPIFRSKLPKPKKP